MIERTVGGLHAHLHDLLASQGLVEVQAGVLDIGCGTGAWLRRVMPMGFARLVGIDYLQPEPVQGLDLRQFDINHDDPDSLGKFGLVSCIEVIEHIENVGTLLDLIDKTLAKNGVAVITTPDIESLRARLRALVSGKISSFDEKSDPTHLCPILYESLEKMLLRRGLLIVGSHQYPADKRKSLMFGRPVKWLSIVLRWFLPDNLYGDNTIYFIRRNQG